MHIQPLAQVTPEWLTETLQAKSALEQGQVTQIIPESETYNKGFTSEITVLKVQYSGDASGALPASLILKRPKADLHPELLSRSAHEARFYQAAHPGLPVPICYDVAYDELTQQSHILMQDLSASHFQKPLPIPPSNRHCEMIVESLAQIHATWWNSPQLGVTLGERLTMEQAHAMNQRMVNTLPAFFDYLGEALLPQQRQAIEKIVASNFLDRLARRLSALEQVTIIHGDAHTGNLMLPHDTTNGRVVLIDWQLWAINVAAIDLAFLIALHWNPQRRALLEMALLQRYHRALLAHGVTGYTWDDLWRDYRESVMIMCLVPIGQFRRKSPAGVVWFGLQDSLSAYQDLRCEELL